MRKPSPLQSGTSRCDSWWMQLLQADFTRHQMDVTTTFLHASLDEEVYMELMEGIQGYGIPGKLA